MKGFSNTSLFRNKNAQLLFSLILISTLLHCVNLQWGNGFYFHPDERNIASAVSQLRFPDQLNPHFFAYGSLPIYSIFLFGAIPHFLSANISQSYTLSFEDAILISRIYSAVFATLVIPLLYSLGTILKNKTTGLTAAGLATLSTGIIQFAHFGTFEMWLTFFSLLLFLVTLKIAQTHKTIYLIYAAIICGALVSIKITSLALVPLPMLALLFHKKTSPKNIIYILQFLRKGLFYIGIIGFLYCITNPYVFLDTNAFLSSIGYESNVAFNTTSVFYTQIFYDTIPLFYQVLHVYPFLLNPIITLLGIIAFLYFIVRVWKEKSINLFLLLLFTAILIGSQAFLFIKWTRYMVPTLPFIYLLVSLFLQVFKNKMKHYLIFLIICISGLFSLSFVITVYLQTDTRVASYEFAKQFIPENAKILSESYDLGILPYNQTYPKIQLFNSYDIDQKSIDYNMNTWNQAFKNADYVILPSQRILQSRFTNPNRFPLGNKIYTDLVTEKSGFTKIYETPCDIFCQISYLGDPAMRFEQTATVFDRPTVMIFKKTLYK